MRRNFAQVLREAKVDIRHEYDVLYELFSLEVISLGFGQYCTLREAIDENFVNVIFRGTCVSLDDFDLKCNYNFVSSPKSFGLEYLVDYCEYIYNLCLGYMCCTKGTEEVILKRANWMLGQVSRLIEEIGYMKAEEDKFVIFVEKSPAAIAVSEILPKEEAYKVISYNHHSMRGNIEEKRSVLAQFAISLEGKREQLRLVNKDLESDIFFLFNNINIRHNNCDESSTKYKKYVADMDNKSIEEWYDRTYQMCLTAFLELERLEEKNELSQLKLNVGK